MTWVDVAWIVVFASLLAGCFILSLRLYRGVATPLFFFAGGYCVSVILYHLRLFEYPDVSLTTHLIVMLSIAAFLLGALLGTPGRKTPHRHSDPGGLNLFFYATAVIAIIGWIIPLLVILGRYGTGHLLANLWILQYEFQMQFLGYLNLVGILVFPASQIKRKHGGLIWIDVVLVLLSLVGLVLAGNKSYLVYSLFGGVLVRSTNSADAVKVRHLVYLGVGVLLFFVIYNQFVDVLGIPQYPGSRIPAPLSFLERPYHYFTGALPAMEQIVHGEMPPRPVPGFVIFQPFWKVCGDLFGLIEPFPKVLPEVVIGPYAFNVYSFAGEVCWDLGPAGVALLSLLLGWALTSLQRRACEGGHWMGSMFYAVFGYGAVIAFFLYYYRFNTYFLAGYVVAAGMLSTWASSRPPRPTPSTSG
ncbi:MAG: oligosaccharide repeat unit polymerase [Thiobacillus sp.]|nr:oligosaccharide repeat unit polymerase [Thiobacillus sp.]